MLAMNRELIKLAYKCDNYCLASSGFIDFDMDEWIHLLISVETFNLYSPNQLAQQLKENVGSNSTAEQNKHLIWPSPSKCFCKVSNAIQNGNKECK